MPSDNIEFSSHLTWNVCLFRYSVNDVLHFLFFLIFILFKNIFLTFIYFWERKRQSMSRGRGRERERERERGRGRHRIWSRLQALPARSPMWSSNSWTVRSWPGLKSDTQLTELPRCPEFLFYFRERVREDTGEGQREERERILSRLHAQPWGSISQFWDHDLSRNQELNT